jgi:Sec-independent protein translocase protein TatA
MYLFISGAEIFVILVIVVMLFGADPTLGQVQGTLHIIHLKASI